MRICVTGGAGFIGSHLADRLVAEGHSVSILDDFSTGRIENLVGEAARCDLKRGDLRRPDDVAAAVKGAEIVYHQGALASVARSLEKPGDVTDVNVRGTANVLVAARDAGVRRVVFASSSSVYGDTPELPKTESMVPSPRSPYAASKAAGEAYMAAWRHSFGLETVVFRYFNVYGPRQSSKSLYAAVVPLFIEAISAGRPPTIQGDGNQTRDFTYVGDVVDALCLAAKAPKAPDAGPMNLGGGHRISIMDLAKTIARRLGKSVTPVHTPPRPGDVRDSLADIRRAEAALGWKPKTRLEDGIQHILDAGPVPVTVSTSASKKL